MYHLLTWARTACVLQSRTWKKPRSARVCGTDDWSINERRDLDTDVVAQRRKDAASHFRSHWREKRFTRLREFTSNQDHLRIECMDD